MDAQPQAPPFADPAKPILAADQTITDENRAELWDTFHASKSPEELASHLQPLAVPDETKRLLYEAKQRNVSLDPVGKVTKVIDQMSHMDTAALDLAESHPNVLKTLTAAVSTPEKGAAAGSGTTSGSGKGKQADAEPAPLVQPPRPDGQPHLPPIPTGHRRVLASDGGIHDIPEERIEDARKLDPLLHVLNP